jgi:hypothetical protein
MPELDTDKSIWRKIQRLKLPRKTKNLLLELWRGSKVLVQAIVRFLYEKKVFCTYLLLGAILYFFLVPLPHVGPLLATMGLSFSLLAAVVKQFEADLHSRFAVIVAQPA